MGIIWLIIFSVIAVVAFILMKLRPTSTTSKKNSNYNNDDSHKPNRTDIIPEGYQGLRNCVVLSQHAYDEGRNADEDKAGESDYKNSLQHVGSIPEAEQDSQSQDITMKGRQSGKGRTGGVLFFRQVAI
jgi:hypothetical protein